MAADKMQIRWQVHGRLEQRRVVRIEVVLEQDARSKRETLKMEKENGSR